MSITHSEIKLQSAQIINPIERHFLTVINETGTNIVFLHTPQPLHDMKSARIESKFPYQTITLPLAHPHISSPGYAAIKSAPGAIRPARLIFRLGNGKNSRSPPP
ncbi:hypothetical protein LVJ83_05210 [Uruburuella testudinis]|uniref:Uncharacterized protein n=1 Tax=Uruburuella testudinis TaxID=1282863 RepID=A0ABY4DUZ5_9NEIS|nr:hypothetical protein [Uruburuella testudinis]UOO82861.1 hypothetical protein LVJ83_05210 [Uruburuella testudinis]